MKIVSKFGWVFYRVDAADELDPSRTGKWMYFWRDRVRVEELCRKAVEQGIVVSAKHTDGEDGVACFYGHIDDSDFHRRVIDFFLANEMIKRTKAGSLSNIAFKLDDQTRAGEYGSDFQGSLKLASLMDLKTGLWL